MSRPICRETYRFLLSVPPCLRGEILASVRDGRLSIRAQDGQPHRPVGETFRSPPDALVVLMAFQLDEEEVAAFRAGDGEGFDPRQIQAVTLENVEGVGQRARAVDDFEH